MGSGMGYKQVCGERIKYRENLLNGLVGQEVCWRMNSRVGNREPTAIREIAEGERKRSTGNERESLTVRISV